jgi:hypothetical protein
MSYKHHADLKKWVGHYPSELIGKDSTDFFNVPEVKESLKRILKPPDLALLTTTLTVESPIYRIDGYLAIERCCPHDCPNENAIVLVGLERYSTVVVFFKNDPSVIPEKATRCYSSGQQLSGLSDSIKERILLMHAPTTWNGTKLVPASGWINRVKCTATK